MMQKMPRVRLLARVLAVLLAAAVGVAIWRISDRPFSGAPGRPGWTIYNAPNEGWSVQFPDSWYAQKVSNVRHGSPYTTEVQSVAISNVDRHFVRVDCGKNCWSPAVDARGLPVNGVVAQIGWSYGGGFGVTCDHDTALPVSLTHARRSTTRNGAGGTPQTELMLPFTVHGSPYYHVRAWIGSQASGEDLRTLEQIVASISYKSTLPPITESQADRGEC